MTQLIVKIDGMTFKGTSSDEITALDLAERFYENLNTLDKLKMPLEDGGVLLLRKEQMQRAVLIVGNTEAASAESKS